MSAVLYELYVCQVRWDVSRPKIYLLWKMAKKNIFPKNITLCQVWCEVWRHLSGPSLCLCLCLCVCWEWRREILRLVTRPPGPRSLHLVLKRLEQTRGHSAIHHKKSVRNTLQFSIDRPTYLHGILVFTGEDKDILGINFDCKKWLFCIFQDLSVPVVFERVTSKLTLSLGELLIAQEVISILALCHECV